MSDEPNGPEGTSLVDVYDAASEFEARTIVALLEDAGITAFVFSLADLPLADALRGRRRVVRVQVTAADRERARVAIEESTAAAKEIDWDAVDVGEEPDEVRREEAGPVEAVAARGLARLGRWAAWGIVGLLLLSGAAAIVVAIRSLGA